MSGTRRGMLLLNRNRRNRAAPQPRRGGTLLEIDDLCVKIGPLPILKRISLRLERGETLALAGESGSGKSMTALSVMRLLPRGAVATGAIRFDGHDLLQLTEPEMCAIRGRDIGFVFQEPMTALNPVQPIGHQIAEPIVWHGGFDAGAAAVRRRVAQLLEITGLAAAGVTPDRYPHQLSGGQRQRVGISIAMALRPKLIIADEPTSALDVTVQAQILDLLRDLAAAEGMALILITHDLAVAAAMAARVAIMRTGEVVEEGTPAEIFREPRTEYTRTLVAAARLGEVEPRLARPAAPTAELIAGEGLVAEFRGGGLLRLGRPAMRAVDGVSIAVGPGESVGLVGESGSGKSTVARMLLGLIVPTSGTVRFRGTPFTPTQRGARRAVYREIQAVFQDPYGSFDPRQTVARIVAEPLHLETPRPRPAERRERVAAALEAVGLPAEAMEKYPHAFSGGQRQRIALARALIVEPALIVADEPVSALDVSIQAQILELFARLRRERGVAYLFISHDLAVVRAVTERVLVMKDGRVVEEGPTHEVFDCPRDPYTQALVAASLDLDDVLAGAA